MIVLQHMSDIHFEYHLDGGKSFISSLNPSGVDIITLAGDIVDINSISALDRLCEHYRDAKVLWVHGNHIYHNTTRERVRDASLSAMRRNPNLIWLNNSSFELNGIKFYGTTLWFPPTVDAERLSEKWAEFEIIPNWKSWVYQAYQEARNFLYKNIDEGDVVITHYLPSSKSVADRFKLFESNCYFVSDQTDIIEIYKPRLWLHGHSHDVSDYTLFGTRIICNPLGNAHDGLNNKFNDNLKIEI